MREIDAINRILRLSGHQSVNVVAEGDQRAATAINTLRQVRRDILSQPYGFNSVKTTLSVDASNRVPVAGSYLSVTLPTGELSVREDTDTGKLYVWDQEADDWYSRQIRHVVAAYDIDRYSSIPETVGQWIAYEAAVQYYAEHKGEPTRYLVGQRNYRKAVARNLFPPLSIHDTIGYTFILAVYRHRQQS